MKGDSSQKAAFFLELIKDECTISIILNPTGLLFKLSSKDNETSQ